MVVHIENAYYVGANQPYATVNQAINTIWTALTNGDYVLPPSTAPDGGNINIIIKGSGKFPGFRLPDNMTQPLRTAGRYLVIKRQEYTENGTLINDSLPVITPYADGASELPLEDRIIGIDIGSNNPNVKIIGLRVQGFIIGISASFNCHGLYLDRNFITNCLNTQVYLHDLEGAYLTNNLIVGGEYGVVAVHVRKLRFYHNTIFLDGLTALSGSTKAGIILQGERFYGLADNNSVIYCLGNLVYTIGCPAAIFYDEDLKNNRLASDYNNFYSQTAVVQLRQDNATLPQDTDQIIKKNYTSLTHWKDAGPLASSNLKVDQHSISVHPVFIQNISLLSNTSSSVINLGSIDNSPLLQQVPAWYHTEDSFYIPTDFNSQTIATDSLLNTRQQPLTAIGANDKQSINGFFGQDIFTSPLQIDPSKKCDLDPLQVISAQELAMSYPAINAGYFWSHERPFYLYGKKGAVNLGYLARTTFNLPGTIDLSKPVTIMVRGKEIPDEGWDVVGKQLTLYHKDYGVTSYEDEIMITCSIKQWYDAGFTSESAYYVFKIKDGKTRFTLPSEYQPGAPVVITDDRIAFTNPNDIVRREFFVDFDSELNETQIRFGGNDNLFENSDFTYSQSGKTPKYWISKIQPAIGQQSVFMLWNQYSYYGDKAVGIRMNNSPGYIISQQIPVHNDDSLCLSWHATIPDDLTGVTGKPITQATGYYIITQFDNYDEELPAKISGQFVMTASGYQRYYVPLGASDQTLNLSLQGARSAPLVHLATGALEMAENITKLELTISGANYSGSMNTGAFFILDAMQAEYAIQPSYYHPKPSFSHMTVEFETSPSGVFVDHRMNITPVFNENPNGFLYIADMPATLWGGPSDPEVTTLHEYRWPHGRINLLPWARLFGKDKLHQKVIPSDILSEPLDIIAPYISSREAAEASMTPAIMRVTQGSATPEGFSIQTIDTLGNPYALRNYKLIAFESHNNFPGWLSKRYLGAKEQLGSTIYGSLNSNGSLHGFYIPPDSSLVRFVGLAPKSLPVASVLSGNVDTISYIKTPYNVSLENNGNITVIGQSGRFHATRSDNYLSGLYEPERDGGKTFITLEYPPVFGSVQVVSDNTKYFESQGDPQSFEFRVNYPFGQVEFSPGLPLDIEFIIKYQPKYAYPDPQEKNVIIFHHNKVFNDYSGPIQVDYDAELSLELEVADPLDRVFVASFPVILQNPQLSKAANQSLSFEF